MRQSGLQKEVFTVLVISNKKIQIRRELGTWMHGCVGMSVCLMEVEELIGLSGEGVACTRHNHRDQGQVRQETRSAVEFRVPREATTESTELI